MDTHNLGSRLIGETVTVSYVADPSISYGQFRLENIGETAITASVEEAWVDFGGDRHPLADVTLFDVGQDKSMNLEAFNVDSKATTTLMLGFPRVVYEPRFGESINVGLRLKINSARLEALSPILFERRIPHNH